MKIYVCWGTFELQGRHACGRAYRALVDAGYKPEAQRVYGEGRLPAFLNPTRKVVRDLSGQQKVPVLRLDDDEIITGSGEIVAWAREHPVGAAA